MTLVDPDLKRRTPNPNVLFETGYAFKSLGFNRILMVFNDAYGETKDLPFDLGLKRVLTYTSPEEDPDRSTARGDLAKNLETKLRTMFGKAQG
ncbi:MAG: hypothetical protein KAI47_17240 [Deltaproteobacteria bacterium]|nr:hypothetical protein [Deltaproteobacteria bacterium]